MMSELIFLIEEAPEGGFTARALGQAIFTEADDLPSLREQIRDAVRCHFEEGQKPAVIRLHFVTDNYDEATFVVRVRLYRARSFGASADERRRQ
jgi:hypothetical protein